MAKGSAEDDVQKEEVMYDTLIVCLIFEYGYEPCKASANAALPFGMPTMHILSQSGTKYLKV